jgi:hypothetical protein
VTVGVGLAVASALGLMLVGALNPLSVAFAVLFVGLGLISPFSSAFATESNGMKMTSCAEHWSALPSGSAHP